MTYALRLLGIFTALLLVAVPAAAEIDADFTAGQAARAEAVAAFRAGDLPLALKHMETALLHRPGHPLLLANVAYLAAETGDPVRATEAANQYVDMGLTLGADIRAALENALAPDAWADLKTRLDANESGIGGASVAAELPSDLKLVEGIAAAPDGTLFLSTVVSRSLFKRGTDGTVTPLLDGTVAGYGSFFGLAYAPSQGLYASYAAIDETPGLTPADGRTGVILVDPATGAVLGDWRLPGTSEAQQIADLAVTADGSLYASDAKGRTVYRLANGQLVPAFRQDGFMSPQGIAETADGQLILADYGRGLWHLDRATGKASLIDAPRGTTLIGIDGLARKGGSLIAIQNGVNPQRLVAINFSADGRFVTAVNVVARALPEFYEPTLGTDTPKGFLFIGASQWPDYGAGGALKGDTPPPDAKILRLQD